MTLVERFIEINRWPTSRKTALLCAFAGPSFFGGLLLIHFAPTGVGDPSIVEPLFAGGTLAMGFCLVVSWLADRAGHEGRWTAYLFVALYGGFSIIMIHGIGMWSTTISGVFPLGVLLVTLYFGRDVALFACVLGVSLTAALTWTDLAGVTPFAPFLLQRGVDAQNTVSWAVTSSTLMFGSFFFAFFMALLIVGARDLQDRRLAEAQRLIRRYVPSQLADAIFAGKADHVERHERRKVTFFFSDVVGFTDIAERMEPEDLSRVLNEYFTEMTAIAARYDGTVDELSGDAILIFFGAPHATDDRDHALRAVRMAQEMQVEIGALNAKWRDWGIDAAFRVRMGVNTGVATIGNFGSEGRTKYAALGRNVNLAARLQAQADAGKVVISHATWLLVQNEIACRSLGELQLKGIAKPVLAYEVS